MSETLLDELLMAGYLVEDAARVGAAHSIYRNPHGQRARGSDSDQSQQAQRPEDPAPNSNYKKTQEKNPQTLPCQIRCYHTRSRGESPWFGQLPNWADFAYNGNDSTPSVHGAS